MNIAVIGGAGFIGQHVARKLKDAGHAVCVIDNLDRQVHGSYCQTFPMLDGIKTVLGDLVDGSVAWGSISGQDVVIHLAASVGVGQSMYAVDDYVDNNSLKTARLLRYLTNHVPPRRLVVASSMSIYGEGATIRCASTGWVDKPVATPETAPPDLRSIYALTKYDQEQLCLIWGRAYNVPTVALRFFNTYGPGQALSNPYTGVMAIFASRLLNGRPPLIYEDGEQSRDFVHVDDVANAVVHAATVEMESGTYNVGTGVATSVSAVAYRMATLLSDPLIEPVITRRKREGDIRHCFADNSKLKATGWTPAVRFADGIRDYCQWLKTQPLPADRVEAAHAELEAHGLTK